VGERVNLGVRLIAQEPTSSFQAPSPRQRKIKEMGGGPRAFGASRSDRTSNIGSGGQTDGGDLLSFLFPSFPFFPLSFSFSFLLQMKEKIEDRGGEEIDINK
jgi:hypothetical protein